MGKAARKAADEARKALERGRKKNGELVEKARVLRVQIENDIVVEQAQITKLENELIKKKTELAQAEVVEKSRVVKTEGKKVGKIGILSQLTKERIEEYKDYSTRMIKIKAEIEGRLERVEGLLTRLKETYNPNFNDEGVKSAVRGWEEYLASRETNDADNTIDDLADLMGDEINWDEYEQDDEPQEVIEESMFSQSLHMYWASSYLQISQEERS